MPMEHNGFVVRMLEENEILLRLRELETHIAPAFEIAHGELTACDALVLATEKKAWVFVGEEKGQIIVTLICEYCQYPRKKVLNILAYAGTARKFYWFLKYLEAWAKANGATEIRGYGHEPQMRLARHHGLKEIYRVYAKDI